MIVTFIKRGNDNDTWGQRWRSTMKVWSPSARSHSANYWHRILEDILSEKILSAFHFFITSFLLPSRRRFLLRSSQSFIKYILHSTIILRQYCKGGTLYTTVQCWGSTQGGNGKEGEWHWEWERFSNIRKEKMSQQIREFYCGQNTN